ncbi:MAG: NAD(P)H-dependent oxidoreductase [Oscillospiraceae bacterium]|nr:NAD(P)H-dependent oxidoreductase [Oscillospiraceae bacterium]
MVTKKALALLFSGRKNGNSSIMMNELLKPIREVSYVELVCVPNLNIKHCVGCFGCNNGELKCIIKDDLDALKGKIAEADLILLVSPCYIFGAPSSMKTILDRLAAWGLDKIENKQKPKIGISISFAGAQGDWCSMQKTTTSLFMKVFNCDVKVQKLYENIALKGEILLHPDILSEGRQIGEYSAKMLLGENPSFHFENDDDRLHCPICKNDSFRIKNNIFTCVVCGHENKRTTFGMKSNETVNKFTPQKVQEHSEFIGNKIVSGFAKSEEINKRLKNYLEDGIVPTEPYIVQNSEKEIATQWDAEGLAEFTRVVPKGFQRFVKKAVEKKAAEQGITLITKDIFLQIKKSSGN